MINIALVGNPNCGKTTIFNALTGSTQYVGNWPGVTVEKKIGRLKGFKEVNLVDLPGIYSLSPYSLEETVARDYLLQERPDAIINIVDVSNIERNLYLTSQLLELGLPVVIALNMVDILHKEGGRVNSTELGQALGCTLIQTTASKGEGLEELAQEAVLSVQKEQPEMVHLLTFNAPIEYGITKVMKLYGEVFTSNFPHLTANTICERWFALKLLERDMAMLNRVHLSSEQLEILNDIAGGIECQLQDDVESSIISQRYQQISQMVQRWVKKGKHHGFCGSPTERLDRVLTHRWLALPIFFFIMWCVYYLSIQTIGGWGTEHLQLFFQQTISTYVIQGLQQLQVTAWLIDLIAYGIIGGVGTVLSFLPQLFILFCCLSFLEDCGYMSRVAFIMDRVFQKFGLSGKSFIPMVIGTGCSVPGIMASRTIENEKDRRMTIILTPFIPCGAKLPVFALFAGAFFPTHSWVGPSMYLIGMLTVIVSGICLKHTRLFAGQPATFVMELPRYQWPKLANISRQVWERSWAFVAKAGTIIFVASSVLWFLQSFDLHLNLAKPNESLLADLGRIIAPLFKPLGFGGWEATVALLTGFLAKETIVATFGVLLPTQDGNIAVALTQLFSPLAAYSFMVFILLSAPCMAAIGTIRREMHSWRWTMIAVGYQLGVAYILSLLIYQLGSYGVQQTSFRVVLVNVAIGLLVLCALIIALRRWLRLRDKFVCGMSACGKAGSQCSRCGVIPMSPKLK